MRQRNELNASLMAALPPPLFMTFRAGASDVLRMAKNDTLSDEVITPNRLSS